GLVADWLCRWAVRSRTDRVLEPSCGDGAFLEGAARRLDELGATAAQVVTQLRGVEMVQAEAARARQRLGRVLGRDAEGAVACQDFFEWAEGSEAESFDCVVGNPPFIRYQNFPEPSRARAMTRMERLGLRP